jgi:serine/threonine protein kinase
MRQQKYALIKALGIGGFGEVWLVRDGGGRLLALKRLIDRAGQRLGELHKEALKLLRLRGAPGIIQLVDHDLSGDDPYIVMELADGTLRDLLTAPVPSKKAAGIALEIANAVNEAHARGVVHRDIKPENIFVKDQRIALGDFGLGKSAESLLATVGGAGTPGYMPPEQIEGPALPKSDVYAVGATLFEMLTHQRPPIDRTGLDPRDAVECPDELANLVVKMTAARVADRPTLKQVQTSLAAFVSQADHEPTTAGPTDPPLSAIVAVGLAIAFVFALIVAIVWFLVSWHDSGDEKGMDGRDPQPR